MGGLLSSLILPNFTWYMFCTLVTEGGREWQKRGTEETVLCFSCKSSNSLFPGGSTNRMKVSSFSSFYTDPPPPLFSWLFWDQSFAIRGQRRGWGKECVTTILVLLISSSRNQVKSYFSPYAMYPPEHLPWSRWLHDTSPVTSHLSPPSRDGNMRKDATPLPQPCGGLILFFFLILEFQSKTKLYLLKSKVPKPNNKWFWKEIF